MKFWEKLWRTSRGFQSEVLLDCDAQKELARGTAIEGCINEQLIGTSIRGRFIAVQQLGGRSTFSRYLGLFRCALGSRVYTKASFCVLTADTKLYKKNVNLVGLTPTGLEYTPFG